MEDFCKDCGHCIIVANERNDIREPIHYCLKHNIHVKRLSSCPDVKEKDNISFIFHSFEVVNTRNGQQVKCPNCKKGGTLKIPGWDLSREIEFASICSNCDSQVRRIHGARYLLIKRGVFPKESLDIDDDGYYYTEIRPLIKHVTMKQYLDRKDVFNITTNKNNVQIATVYKQPNVIGYILPSKEVTCLNCISSEDMHDAVTVLQTTKKEPACNFCGNVIKPIDLPDNSDPPTSLGTMFFD